MAPPITEGVVGDGGFWTSRKFTSSATPKCWFLISPVGDGTDAAFVSMIIESKSCRIGLANPVAVHRQDGSCVIKMPVWCLAMACRISGWCDRWRILWKYCPSEEIWTVIGLSRGTGRAVSVEPFTDIALELGALWTDLEES
ncbi:MAG: hypothetical protein R3F44_08670 [Candidatus Competibacteraceae bacterium]